MDLSNSPSGEMGKVSIVIPVLNELGNIDPLIEGLVSLPHDRNTSRIRELIFVDDGSTDGTVERILDYNKEKNGIKITVLERNLRQGTVNAQLYGISYARTEAVIIMDGDLQHPADYIPALIEKYFEGHDLVLASRYVRRGSAERKPFNGMVSRGANILSKFFLPWVRNVKDPISGYFIVNRKLVNTELQGIGFNKLALNLLSSGRKLSVAEVPFRFKERRHGSSKVADGGYAFLIRFLSEILFYRKMYMQRARFYKIDRTTTEPHVLK